MKVLDLFSGIGGFSLGLERAGMKTVAFCEIDKFCQRVLKKHWPDIPIYDDIRKLDGKQFRGSIDLICGGYPCQPFSVAGKRRGSEDDRHLWPEYFRLIREIQPQWVVGENVYGHINMGLDEVLFDLESEGYTWETFIIPACAVDAPHKRDRVWVIAHSDSVRGWQKQECQPGSSHTPQFGNDGKTQLMADTNSKWKLQQERCVKNFWRAEPGICRVVNGLPNGMDQIRALGNSVVPQIVEIIGRAIIATDIDQANADKTRKQKAVSERLETYVYDHRPEAASLLNLAALCQKCHNGHDQKMRSANRKERDIVNSGQQEFNF